MSSGFLKILGFKRFLPLYLFLVLVFALPNRASNLHPDDVPHQGRVIERRPSPPYSKLTSHVYPIRPGSHSTLLKRYSYPVDDWNDWTTIENLLQRHEYIKAQLNHPSIPTKAFDRTPDGIYLIHKSSAHGPLAGRYNGLVNNVKSAKGMGMELPKALQDLIGKF